MDGEPKIEITDPALQARERLLQNADRYNTVSPVREIPRAEKERNKGWEAARVMYEQDEQERISDLLNYVVHRRVETAKIPEQEARDEILKEIDAKGGKFAFDHAGEIAEYSGQIGAMRNRSLMEQASDMQTEAFSWRDTFNLIQVGRETVKKLQDPTVTRIGRSENGEDAAYMQGWSEAVMSSGTTNVEERNGRNWYFPLSNEQEQEIREIRLDQAVEIGKVLGEKMALDFDDDLIYADYIEMAARRKSNLGQKMGERLRDWLQPDTEQAEADEEATKGNGFKAWLNGKLGKLLVKEEVPVEAEDLEKAKLNLERMLLNAAETGKVAKADTGIWLKVTDGMSTEEIHDFGVWARKRADLLRIQNTIDPKQRLELISEFLGYQSNWLEDYVRFNWYVAGMARGVYPAEILTIASECAKSYAEEKKAKIKAEATVSGEESARSLPVEREETENFWNMVRRGGLEMQDEPGSEASPVGEEAKEPELLEDGDFELPEWMKRISSPEPTLEDMRNMTIPEIGQPVIEEKNPDESEEDAFARFLAADTESVPGNVRPEEDAPIPDWWDLVPESKEEEKTASETLQQEPVSKPPESAPLSRLQKIIRSLDEEGNPK